MWRAAKVFLLLPKVCVLNPICDLSHAIQCLLNAEASAGFTLHLLPMKPLSLSRTF